jgi:hypothetical protein
MEMPAITLRICNPRQHLQAGKIQSIMTLTRRLRFLTALIALVGLLFAQLAVAGYSCPAHQAGITSAPAAASANSDDQRMPGCGQMDKELPSLCHAHAQVGNQSLDKPELPSLPPFSAAALTLVVTHIAMPDFSVDHFPQSSPLLARITAPPLSIRHCCFRI